MALVAVHHDASVLISTFVIVYTFSITLLLTLVGSIAKRITNGKKIKSAEKWCAWPILGFAIVLAIIDMVLIAFAIGDIGATTLDKFSDADISEAVGHAVYIWLPLNLVALLAAGGLDTWLRITEENESLPRDSVSAPKND